MKSNVRVRDLCGIDRKATNGAIALIRMADECLSRAILAREIDDTCRYDDPRYMAGSVRAHVNPSECTIRS